MANLSPLLLGGHGIGEKQPSLYLYKVYIKRLAEKDPFYFVLLTSGFWTIITSLS